MIGIQVPEPDPIEATIVAWCRRANLYRDGALVREGVNLLGSNELAAKAWAKAVANHLAADGEHDHESLATFLLTQQAAQHVRAYSSAPLIAEGLLVMLTERGLL
ncbi:hypothetical protein [Nocardia terpenica]|uniref:Uncharacterized protein n=1 Tax=Nocardia terpenica TaxID=455432 RepID=A0A164JVV9_9NOCA|nr:hypothetical protein [Nocardia terpenica]KZM70772.1 hypothetical protein AWN90_40155 [Nocardia terpenica]NQE89961.1 hypothetical protein [Nocardia terpenica]